MSHKTPRKERLNNIASGEYLPSFHFTLYRLVISRYLLRVTYDTIIGLMINHVKERFFVGIRDSNPVRNASPHQPNAFGLYPIDCLQNQKICMQLKPPRFQAWNTSWGNFFPFHFFPLLHCAPFSTPGVAKVYAPGISATCKLPVG